MNKLLFFVLILVADQAIADDVDNKCLQFINASKNNYKIAHTNKFCLDSANSGNAIAQYSVGMAYGFAEKSDLEEKYYALSADQGNTAAYLALGHVLSKKSPWEAIYWYQRYYSTKNQGYGYAAQRLSRVFEALNQPEQQKYWHEKCKESDYKGCS